MTDEELIESLQKQLDLTNKNYNTLNEKYCDLMKEHIQLKKDYRYAERIHWIQQEIFDKVIEKYDALVKEISDNEVNNG